MSDAAHPIVAGLAGLATLRKRRKKERARDVSPRRKAISRIMTNILIAPFKAVLYTALLIVYLVAEVLAAMLAYIYLNLNHVGIFGELVRLSRELLNRFAEQLEVFSPELANQAYATLLGELGPKSVLLLFLGLAVSAIIRLMIWSLHVSRDKIRKSAGTAQSAAA